MTISIVKDSVYKHISGTLDVNVRTYSVLTNSHTYKVSAKTKWRVSHAYQSFNMPLCIRQM